MISHETLSCILVRLHMQNLVKNHGLSKGIHGYLKTILDMKIANELHNVC